jgi:hypothetical protein
MRHLSVMVSVLLLIALSSGQQPPRRMSNQDVIDMVGLGLSEDVIIDKIHASATDFDTDVAGLKILKLGKVSDTVIRVMINPHLSTAVADDRGAPSPTIIKAVLPVGAGVYTVLDGKPTEIEPEVVNWQTGGVAKSHASLFIVKGDVNGKVMKPASPTQINTPVEFLIKTLEGTSAAEYQLLRLHQKGNRREFRSVTGGVLHQSGGAQRDEVPFQPEKVGDRSWRVRVDSLQPGEYGFLAPGTSSVSISASGKMYTFGVLPIRHDVRKENAPQGERKSNAQNSVDVSLLNTGSSPEFKDATIGAVSSENPTIRHDGITLDSVTPGGPSDRAGIKAGDVIVAVDDHYLFTVGDLDAQIKRHKPGTQINVRYRRYSTIYDTSLVVGSSEKK